MSAAVYNWEIETNDRLKQKAMFLWCVDEQFLKQNSNVSQHNKTSILISLWMVIFQEWHFLELSLLKFDFDATFLGEWP